MLLDSFFDGLMLGGWSPSSGSFPVTRALSKVEDFTVAVDAALPEAVKLSTVLENQIFL